MTTATIPSSPPTRADGPSTPHTTSVDPKITARHLSRHVLIYVRQSSPTQVHRHPESARRQYALAERAQRLGWAPEQITIIDEDQGKSGAGSAAAHEREGFGRLVSAVGLGEVGLILALEVARLARNSAEWYRLLELAALAGVLIADEATIYDPRAFNDRLLLGLRGTISEVELHCIQERLHGARMSKARRGEFPLGLPVGYIRDREGRIEFDPDQAVQGAIHTIFTQFESLEKASGVLQFFRDHGLTVPRRQWGGIDHGQLVWAKPTYQAIHQILSNPAYAGAYVYGRRRQDDGGVGLSEPRRRFAIEEAEVVLQGHHPAYLSWERYRANRAILRDNSRQFAPSPGAPLKGIALLQGIVYCGRCGCRMLPHYSLSSPTYMCNARKRQYGEPICQSLTINHVDQAVSDAFLAVIRPAELEAVLALSEEFEREQTQIEQQWQLRLERARYEAERARRQYDQCEPENRLVARELEHRWNEQLRAVAELEEEYRREHARGLTPLSAEERTLLRSLVGDLPTLWHAAATTMEERKRLLRCVIQEVILRRDEGDKGAPGTTTIQIGWRSGAWSELQVQRPGSGDHARTAETVVKRIRGLAQQVSDDRVSEVLNAEGLTTRMGLSWTAERVRHIRAYHGIPTACPVMPQDSETRGDGLISVRAAAERLGVVPTSFAHWCTWGYVQTEQRGPGSPCWLRLTEEDFARLDGTLGRQGYGRWTLPQAKHALGLTREEIWERARHGEFIAYRAHVGDHWEWRLTPVDAQAATPAGPGLPASAVVAADGKDM